MSEDNPPKGVLRAPEVVLVMLVIGAATLLLGDVDRVVLGGSPDRDPLERLALHVAAVASYALAMVGAIDLFVVRWRGVTWEELGLRPGPPYWYLLGAALGVLALLLLSLLAWGIGALTAIDLPKSSMAFVAPIGFSWFALVAMTILLVIATPFAEELAFRGLLYRWSRDHWGVLPGVVLSSLVFSALHGMVETIPMFALLGAILALVYEKSGSLWPGIITHGTFNLVITLGTYVFLARAS